MPKFNKDYLEQASKIYTLATQLKSNNYHPDNKYKQNAFHYNIKSNLKTSFQNKLN